MSEEMENNDFLNNSEYVDNLEEKYTVWDINDVIEWFDSKKPNTVYMFTPFLIK